MSRKYIVRPRKNSEMYGVFELFNNKLAKVIGNYPKSTALLVAKKYNDQEAALHDKQKKEAELRNPKMETPHTKDDEDVLSQAEAMRMMDDIRRQLKSD